MNRYLSLACSLVAFFYLSSCESYSEPTEKNTNPINRLY